MDNKYRVRHELWVIALLLRRPGVTRKEIEKLISRLLDKLGHYCPKNVSDLISYIDYLVQIGVVVDENGRLYLRQDKLSNFLMKYVRQIADSDLIDKLLSEFTQQERMMMGRRVGNI
jgi:RNA binding exosome subunit